MPLRRGCLEVGAVRGKMTELDGSLLRVAPRGPSAARQLRGLVPFRGAQSRRDAAEGGGELLGAVQRALALCKTGPMKPEMIFTDRLTLERLPTAGTFFSVVGTVELPHASSTPPGTQGGT